MYGWSALLLVLSLVIMGVSLFFGMEKDKENLQLCKQRVQEVVQYVNDQNEVKFKRDEFQTQLMSKREEDIAWIKPRYVQRTDMNQEITTQFVDASLLHGKSSVVAPIITYKHVM